MSPAMSIYHQGLRGHFEQATYQNVPVQDLCQGEQIWTLLQNNSATAAGSAATLLWFAALAVENLCCPRVRPLISQSSTWIISSQTGPAPLHPHALANCSPRKIFLGLGKPPHLLLVPGRPELAGFSRTA